MREEYVIRPGRRRHRKVTAYGTALLAGIALGCTDVRDASNVLAEATPIVPSGIVLRGPHSPPGQPIDLFRALDIAVIGDSLVLVDNGNDRIVLIDSALNVVWTRGATGAGPGEFVGPFGIAASPAGMVTLDFGNGRFTEYDRTGNVLRTTSAPSPTRSFGVRSDGAIVTPNRGHTHYAFVVDTGGKTPFAERPDTADAHAAENTSQLSALILVTAGDTVHVLDDYRAELLKYDPEGRLVGLATLPHAVVDSIRTRDERQRSAFAKQGLRMLPSGTTKDMTLTGDGRLLVVLSAANTVAILIDPHTYAARRIIVPSEETEWAPLRKASSMALLGHRLYALQGDSVFVYEIDESK